MMTERSIHTSNPRALMPQAFQDDSIRKTMAVNRSFHKTRENVAAGVIAFR